MPKRIPTMLSVMTPFPYSISVDCCISEAKAMMSEHEIRHLPVTENHRLIGIVTDRDIKRAQTPECGSQPDEDLNVGDALVSEVYMVDVNESLDNVLMHMWEHRIGSTLVLKAGKLVGIFTASDACKLFATILREEFQDPDNEIA